MDRNLGRDCQALLNTGSFGTPTFSEMTFVNDPQETAQRPTAEVRGRGEDLAVERPGAKRGGYTFQTINLPSNSDFTALRDAYDNGTTVLIWFADGDPATSGTTGIHAEWYVTQFQRNEPDENGVSYAVEVKPASLTNWERRTT